MIRFAIIEKKHANWMYMLSNGFRCKSPEYEMYHVPAEAQGADPYVYVVPLSIPYDDLAYVEAIPAVRLFEGEAEARAYADTVLNR